MGNFGYKVTFKLVIDTTWALYSTRLITNESVYLLKKTNFYIVYVTDCKGYIQQRMVGYILWLLSGHLSLINLRAAWNDVCEISMSPYCRSCKKNQNRSSTSSSLDILYDRKIFFFFFLPSNDKSIAIRASHPSSAEPDSLKCWVQKLIIFPSGL
jgi:hypothetical protein